MLQAGDVAPAFTATDHLGNQVSLAALRGRMIRRLHRQLGIPAEVLLAS